MSLILAALVVVPLQIAVRTYDSVGISPGELDQARASVGAILAGAGITPIWRQCHQSACTEPVKPYEVAVRIVTSGPLSVPDSLGFSVVDVSQRAGSLATIYEDRVQALALQSEVDSGLLLGRVIAHEVGHMLLGTSTHSRGGLMRALWATGELRRDLPSDWLFSRSETAELRRRVIARTESAALPAAIVAELEASGAGLELARLSFAQCSPLGSVVHLAVRKNSAMMAYAIANGHAGASFSTVSSGVH